MSHTARDVRKQDIRIRYKEGLRPRLSVEGPGPVGSCQKLSILGEWGYCRARPWGLGGPGLRDGLLLV